MIENTTAVTNIGYAGLAYDSIRRSLDAGKETKESREIRVEKSLEDTKKVQLCPQVYNAQEKIVKHNKGGMYLDIITEYYKKKKHLDVKA